MTPETLSRELRFGSSRFLRLRRRSLSLSLIAAGAMAPIALYQMGVIRHLLEPPLSRLNAVRSMPRLRRTASSRRPTPSWDLGVTR
jgi:hypothetical protein